MEGHGNSVLYTQFFCKPKTVQKNESKIPWFSPLERSRKKTTPRDTKRTVIWSAGKDVMQQIFTLLVRMANGTTTLENSMGISYDPLIPLLGI